MAGTAARQFYWRIEEAASLLQLRLAAAAPRSRQLHAWKTVAAPLRHSVWQLWPAAFWQLRGSVGVSSTCSRDVQWHTTVLLHSCHVWELGRMAQVICLHACSPAGWQPTVKCRCTTQCQSCHLDVRIETGCSLTCGVLVALSATRVRALMECG